MKIIKLNENRPYATHRGRDITDTNHSIDRSYERGQYDSDKFPTIRDYKIKHTVMIKQAIDQILDKYHDTASTYVVYSRGSGLGVVISWRLDRFSGDTRNHAYIVTVLKSSPRPHYLTHKDDIQLFVEMQDALRDYIVDEKRKLVENVDDKYQRVEIEKDFIAHMYEGKVTDVEIEPIIVE